MRIDLYDSRSNKFEDVPRVELKPGEKIFVCAADVDNGDTRHLQLLTLPLADPASVVVSAPYPLRQEVENQEVPHG